MSCRKMVRICRKIRNIIIGTYRNIFNKKQDLATQRLKYCNKCEHRMMFMGQYICDQCGCILESKVRVEDEHCVIDKW
jgi:hypothetical protein